VGKKGVPKPHIRAAALPKVVPRPKEFRPATQTGLLRFRFNCVDIGGPWCLSEIAAHDLRSLLARLKDFESMSCTQVFAPGSEMGKIYEVASLPSKAARDRLLELEYDDQAELARVRINGKQRLYGFLPDRGPEFYVLWWDPRHEIWPSRP